MTERLRSLWTRLRSRPDTEHEQALIRLAVGIALFFYLLPGAFVHAGEQRQTDLVYLGAMLAFLAAAGGLIASILLHPGSSPSRRILGAAVDAGATTFFMIAAGVYALPLFLVYVWITFANGFRYGAAYLVTSLALSVATFGLVLAFSPFWNQHIVVGLGLITGLVVLSLYVLTLVRRMSAAVERAEAANAAKRRFISVVSHEMRTPLNAIINMADLMRDTPLNREQVDMLQTLSGSSKVLLGLVEDVLDFSKIEAGKLTLERTEFDLRALMEATAKILAPQAQDKGLVLEVRVMPDVATALRGDPHHLRQILINLVGNAIKFTQKGSVTLHVSVLSETERAVALKFSVRDTGIGIAPEAQERIFDSFAQADESMTRRFGGTGLGTTIARQLVELMGGRMGVESAVGLGSTFWFEIELEKQPGDVSPPQTELADARVLVIGFAPEDRGSAMASLVALGARPIASDKVDEAADQTLREIGIAPAPRAALVSAPTIPGATTLIAQLRRAIRLPELPVVAAVPREAWSPGVSDVGIARTALVDMPFDKAGLLKALLDTLGDSRERSDVVAISEYRRKRESGRGLRALVADDNAANRTVISKILERAGHSAELVGSGEQVLDALERERYDLVILDRNMPDLGGVEALRRLRLLYMGPERLPVIVLSADVTPEAKQECLDSGADAFLPKPIEASRLLDVIAELGARPETRETPPARRPSLSLAAPEVLNRETIRLLEELGSDTEFMERLIGAFLKDIEVVLGKLDGDGGQVAPGELRSLVHALKGSVSSVGADRMTGYCVRVASMSDATLRAEHRALVRALREEFEAVRQALAEYLRARKRTAG